MEEYRLLSTSGLLGYGFPEESLERGLARRPHMIGVDGGSTDPGPSYLGSGKCVNSRVAMKRDIRLMLKGALREGIPLVIGSCGGAGARPHLDTVAEITREVAAEEGLRFRMALIHADQTKDDVKAWRKAGRITPLRNVPELTDEAIEASTNIVGMMGPEPFQKALDGGAQVVLAGRSSDPAPWAGCATRAQLPPAPAWYAGKMLECGATASLPKGHDCLLTTVRRDGVEVEATNPIRKCTPFSVANHALHENSSPCHHIEPGGMLDTSDCRFEAVNDRAVFVSGMKWEPRPYSVKLEGASLAGYRAITICGTRDPLLIGMLDDYLASVRRNVEAKAADFGVPPSRYTLIFRTYGRDGVMGAREPLRNTATPHEIGIVVEVVAPTQDEANAVLSIARVNTLHVDFPGRLCKEGNMAFPYSPSDIVAGPAYRFSVFHVLQVEDPLALFPITHEEVG
jgi:hypothetical protein